MVEIVLHNHASWRKPKGPCPACDKQEQMALERPALRAWCGITDPPEIDGQEVPDADAD